MSDDLNDLDDLAKLWAEEPAAEEKAEMRGLAQRVSRRATLLRLWDMALGVAIAAGVLIAVLLKPAPVTMAIGLVAAGGLLWSTWKRHLLTQQVGLLIELSDRSRLVDHQLRRVTTELYRARVTLFAMPPAILLFGMLTYGLDHGGSLAGFGAAVADKFMDGLVGPALVAAMLTLIIHQAQNARHLRGELLRLRILGGQYREEARLDGIAVR